MRQYFENGAFNKCLKNAELENAEKSITRTFSKVTLRATLPNSFDKTRFLTHVLYWENSDLIANILLNGIVNWFMKDNFYMLL